MPTQLATMRPETISIDEAREVFRRVAEATIAIEKIKAAAEARIAKIKADTEDRLAPIRDVLAQAEALLRAYIIARPERFRRPRQIRTDWGTFGRRTLPPDVRILDRDSLIHALLEAGYDDCLKTTHSPVKSSIRHRIEGGSRLRGAQLRAGYEEATYTVARALIDRAREDASA